MSGVVLCSPHLWLLHPCIFWSLLPGPPQKKITQILNLFSCDLSPLLSVSPTSIVWIPYCRIKGLSILMHISARFSLCLVKIGMGQVFLLCFPLPMLLQQPGPVIGWWLHQYRVLGQAWCHCAVRWCLWFLVQWPLSLLDQKNELWSFFLSIRQNAFAFPVLLICSCLLPWRINPRPGETAWSLTALWFCYLNALNVTSDNYCHHV